MFSARQSKQTVAVQPSGYHPMQIPSKQPPKSIHIRPIEGTIQRDGKQRNEGQSGRATTTAHTSRHTTTTTQKPNGITASVGSEGVTSAVLGQFEGYLREIRCKFGHNRKIMPWWTWRALAESLHNKRPFYGSGKEESRFHSFIPFS